MIAIYARQSVDKKDSISIDTQIDYCKTLCTDEFKVYKDSGFSGSNTFRPEFQKLLSDIELGKVNKVIAYRLDRISRSLTDFAKLIELFNNKTVQFVSATEQFDTSSPMGRAMIYIIMVFAQLERETIATRIRDNYYARAEKGLFLGGGCSIGYKSNRINVDGKNISILEEDIENSEYIKELFRLYAYTSASFSSIAKSNDGTWHANKVRRILTNPVYVENSPEIYNFFKLKGYKMYNPIDDFDCKNGCMIVGKESCKHDRKYHPVEEQTFLVGYHKPLIDSKTFLLCQKKMATNAVTKRSGTSKKSWLSGLIKCGECNHSMTIKTSLSGNKKITYTHFLCQGRANYGKNCCDNKKMYRSNDYEAIVEEKFLNRLEHVDFNTVKVENKDNSEIIKLKADIIKIDEKIENLLEQMSEGVVGSYINKKIESLDKEKKILQTKLLSLDSSDNELLNISEIKSEIYSKWNDADINERHRLCAHLIDHVKFFIDGRVDIVWKY